MKLTHKGYTGNYEFGDHAYFGTVEIDKDAITFQSDEESGIQKAFEDSVDDYLEFCAERCEEPQPPRRIS